MARFDEKRAGERRVARSLAEAIIFQALQDLWSAGTAVESLEFFAGDGFIDCADVIGMSLDERQEVMLLAGDALRCSPRKLKVTVWPLQRDDWTALH